MHHFISWILKINYTLIDNAEDFDIVIPMQNLFEYRKNYSKTTGSLWIYYRDEPNSGSVGDKNYSIRGSKYFDYETNNTARLEGNNTEKEVEIAVPLKHLRNFWKTLDIPLINCEINLILTWSENCVITIKAATDAKPDADSAVAAVNNSTNATFKITDTKLYVPVVTLEQLKTGFKRTIKWNKYRSKMSHQGKNNLNYLIDPTFNRVNRLFVLSFENEHGRTSFSKNYTPSVEIKDCNVLIDGNSFFSCSNKKKRRNIRKNY